MNKCLPGRGLNTGIWKGDKKVREGLLGRACGMAEVKKCHMIKGLIRPAHEFGHILTEESLEGFRIRFVCYKMTLAKLYGMDLGPHLEAGNQLRHHCRCLSKRS